MFLFKKRKEKRKQFKVKCMHFYLVNIKNIRGAQWLSRQSRCPYTEAVDPGSFPGHLWPFAACHSPSLSPVSCPLFSCPVLIKAQNAPKISKKKLKISVWSHNDLKVNGQDIHGQTALLQIIIKPHDTKRAVIIEESQKQKEQIWDSDFFNVKTDLSDRVLSK